MHVLICPHNQKQMDHRLCGSFLLEDFLFFFCDGGVSRARYLMTTGKHKRLCFSYIKKTTHEIMHVDANLHAIQAVEIFQSGPKWGTDQTTCCP